MDVSDVSYESVSGSSLSEEKDVDNAKALSGKLNEYGISVDSEALQGCTRLRELGEALRTLDSTDTGKALLRAIGQQMQAYTESECILQFTTDDNQITAFHSPRVVDGKIMLRVNMNFKTIPNDTYEYLVKKDDESLGFVQVIHPPAVVLGHELGHVLQRLSHSETLLNNEGWKSSSQKEYIDKMDGVRQAVLRKIQDILPPGIDIKDCPLDDLPEYISSLAKNFPGTSTQLDNIIKALGFVITVWNGGYHDDLLNILPTAIDDHHYLSDGQLLKEVAHLGQEHIRCFYIENVLFGRDDMVIEDHNQSISGALFADQVVPTRYGHRDFTGFLMDCYLLKEVEAKELVDEFILALLQSFDIQLEQIPRMDIQQERILDDMQDVPMEIRNRGLCSKILGCWSKILSCLRCGCDE